MKRRGRWLLLGCLVTLLLSGGGIGLAREAVLTTDQGQRFTGQLIEQTDETVVLEIGGLVMRFGRDRIETLELLPDPAQWYEQQLGEIDAEDVEARLDLTRVLLQRGWLDQAEQEIASLEADFPEAEGLGGLERRLRQLRLLERMHAEGGERPGREGAPGDEPSPPIEGDERLSERQINLYRLYELNPQHRPRVHVPPAVMRELFERYADHPAVPGSTREQQRLMNAPGYEQVRVLFAARARELYPRVQVPEDPPALGRVRSRIHSEYVINHCATTDCHGGGTGSNGLVLVREAARTTPTFYTNLHRLDRARHEGDRLIDRRRPARSLLLQYGLPRERAGRAHPDVPGWRPWFTGPNDPRFRHFVELLGELRSSPPPEGVLE